MGNMLFSQKKSQEKVPEEIVKKAKKVFSKTYLSLDQNISSVGSGETYIQVGLVEMGKSDFPSHFSYTCPDSGKMYSIPIKIVLAGRAHDLLLRGNPKKI